MTLKQLQEKLVKSERELTSVRFHVKTGQNQDNAAIRKLRTQVAQVKTLLNDEEFVTSKTVKK